MSIPKNIGTLKVSISLRYPIGDAFQRECSTVRSLGKWIASTPVPEQSLETRETRLQGEEKLLLLELVRKLLCWLPEDRKSAEGLYDDPFIQGYARE